MPDLDAGSIKAAVKVVPGTQHGRPGERLTSWSVI
jgi:hypothetical protein